MIRRRSLQWLLPVICLATLAAQTEVPSIRIKFEWTYTEIPPGMRIFDVARAKELPLWKTGTVAKLEEAPVTQEILESTIDMKPGQKKRFALVYSNATDKPVYFFAAPHSAQPVEFSLGFKFKCLCINHAFKVGPGETWYRIVEFRLAKEFVGDHLTIKHNLVGLDAARAERFNKSMSSSMHNDM